MSSYRTVQGDMWDIIAHKVYGDEKKMNVLIEANPSYRDVYIFPAGAVLNVPDLEDRTEIQGTGSAPVWR